MGSVETQIALNPQLKNPFVLYELSSQDLGNPSRQLQEQLQNDFELGRIIVLEGLQPENLEYFLKIPSVHFSQWVPPVEDHEILKIPVDASHPFWSFYPNKETLMEFQEKLISFQSSWEHIHKKLFSQYHYKKRYWSWRFNHMDLGYLHLDVPPPYQEHQMRCFMNLSQRARILEIGPSLESFIHKFYEEYRLEEIKHLETTDYLQEIKSRLFKENHFDEHFIPRHTLRLSPGAVWISHSSLITHGLVYGEKTVCLEIRIPPEQIKNQERYFHRIMQKVKINDLSGVDSFSLSCSRLVEKTNSKH